MQNLNSVDDNKKAKTAAVNYWMKCAHDESFENKIKRWLLRKIQEVLRQKD